LPCRSILVWYNSTWQVKFWKKSQVCKWIKTEVFSYSGVWPQSSSGTLWPLQRSSICKWVGQVILRSHASSLIHKFNRYFLSVHCVPVLYWLWTDSREQGRSSSYPGP
jgi:hypothetical protein